MTATLRLRMTPPDDEHQHSRRRWALRLFLVGAVLSLFAVLACARKAPGAPAPLVKTPARPKTRAGYAGQWTAWWYGTPGAATLSPDGSYYCRWCGSDWVGTWDVQGGKIVVTEARVPTEQGLGYYTYVMPIGGAASVRICR